MDVVECVVAESDITQLVPEVRQRELERRELIEGTRRDSPNPSVMSTLDLFVVSGGPTNFGRLGSIPPGEIRIMMDDVEGKDRLATPLFLMDFNVTLLPLTSQDRKLDIEAINKARKKMNSLTGACHVLDPRVQIDMENKPYGVKPRVTFSLVDAETGVAPLEWKIGLVDFESGADVRNDEVLSKLVLRTGNNPRKEVPWFAPYFKLDDEIIDGTRTLRYVGSPQS